MQNDKTTLKDLSILNSADSVFQLLDFCVTQRGREALRKHLLHPPNDLATLRNLQEVVRFFATQASIFPTQISNGTLVMLETFFESADHLPQRPSGFQLVFNAFFQKTLNRNEYSFNQFSVSHLSDFVKGCNEFAGWLDKFELPSKLREILQAVKEELAKQSLTTALLKVQQHTRYKELALLSYRARRELKAPIAKLLHFYAQLDAWQSLGKAAVVHQWSFPALQEAHPVVFDAIEVYHPLLKQPQPYSIHLGESQNFLLLTGANMSGKTTFMRSLGVASFLAHIGSAVPAKKLTLSFLQGIITNMHIEDNILLGESLFMAEVQRIKQTAMKVPEANPRLILMDELFKGTNVHDAYECTKAVIEGLLQHKHHIMVLSTHLYEVAQHFSGNDALSFGYFETDVTAEGNYSFSYALKKGISKDRIGYRILEKEGVLKLLHRKRG